VRGPVNPSLNESAGLLVDGFESDPSVLMPYNPRSYPVFVESCGYRGVKDLWAWDLDLGTGPNERLARLGARVSARGDITIRSFNPGAFDREIATLQRIYQRAWRDNWGFVVPTEGEVRQLAKDFKTIIDPEIVIFAEVDGQAVGCAVAIPNVNQVLKKMHGRLFPFGIFHFLRRRALVDEMRVLLLGVDPDVRLRGLYPLLIAELHRRAVARGYRSSELSWTLEDNDAINAGIEATGARRSKIYRLYEKSVR
jgi:hypothetical protein